ncbi:MAG TPA: sigma-70 family RNA polymerase sigma factor [Planctomycetota bacterium]
MAARFDLDALLAETRWLGDLARQLVGHRHDAEELVQETLRTAIERPPATDRPLRGWLRTVLLSRSRDRHRAESARCLREHTAPAGDAAPSTLDVVVKAEVHRELVNAVLALEEPHRSCLLLRFFENLPPRAIARRTAVPVATVHSRLQRALAMLRSRYAETRGPRWQKALAPLLHRAPLIPSLLLGVSLVNALGKVTLGAVAVAVAIVFWPWPNVAEVQSTGEAAPPRQDTALVAAPAAERTHAGAARIERTEPPAPDSPGANDAKQTAPRVLRGRVIDLHGTCLAGIALAVHDRGERELGQLVSEAGGAFELTLPPAADTIVSRDPRWATVLEGSARVQAANQSTVVIAPRLELGGRVTDARGTPLPGAAVVLHLPSHLGAELGILLDYSVARTWRAVCNAEGRFRLPDVPSVENASLTASLGGFEPRITALPAASTDLLELVLDRPRRDTALVEGLVVDPWGAAVAGARVSAGGAVSITDARGGFTIDLAKNEAPARIVAVARGMQPCTFVPERDAAGVPAFPARVVLQLGAPPLSMRGRVVDRAGRPVAGARVWVADPLLVGVEGDVVLAETLLGRTDRPFWAFVLADEAGAFQIDGLLDRAYVVRALEPATLSAVTQQGVPGGSSDVELRLDAELHRELRGRVTARDGSPIADVSVKLHRPALEVQVPGGTRDEWATGASMRTNELGEFRFANVPVEGVEVFASGDSIQFAGRRIEPGIDPTAFVLQADRRVHLQIELAPPTDRADRVRVLDAAGKPMVLRIMRGETSFTNTAATLVGGRSQILSLGEGAATAVFLRSGVEVGRMPVQLAVGSVNKVRY